ncbi:MAG TPA: hypothetical protein VF756_22795 [Thermoanaerobaculia bacterium]
MRISPVLACSILLTALAGCGAEPRLPDSGPPRAELPRKLDPGANGAVLVTTGRQAFEGRSTSRCVIHDGTGLQINLRTGDPDLPAVAVRIPDFRGSGPYRGFLFVTGRNRAGALVGSTGEVSLKVQQKGVAASGGAPDLPALLSGWFEGTYDGAAGRGTVQGRFGGCAYARTIESPLPAVPDKVAGPVAGP